MKHARVAGLKELKAKLLEIIRDVERGETILVTRHGRVVAKIVPPMASEAAPLRREDRLARLADEGFLRLPRASPEQITRLRAFTGLRLPRGTARSLLDAERGDR